MAKKKIVIVGAGFAGVSATRLLAKNLKNDAEITVIDKHDFQTSMTQLHEVAASRVEADAVQYHLNRTIGKFNNVKVVKESLVELDKANKKVITDKNSYDYDYLVVSMGGEPNDFGVPGVNEYGFTLWSLEDALKIKAHLKEMVQAAAKKYGIPESEFTINIVEMMPTIMNILDRSLADKALVYLQNKNINVLVNHGITAVAQDHITVNVGGRDEEKVVKEIPGNTLIWTTGVQGNTEAEACQLSETERGHRLQANEYMEAIGEENHGIYVAGDVSGYIVPENGRPTPQIVEAAEQTGSTAAKNIIADIKGGEKTKFVGNYRGTLVSIGSGYAVGTVGKTKLSGFSATFMKHMVYLVYTFEIRSGHYFFKYINDQLFHKGAI